ncbi:glutathione S-transferase, partial [Arhodomonas sp. KWT2]
MDARLAEQPFVAGDTFSIAYITAVVRVDLAAGPLVVQRDVAPPHVRQGHARARPRPTASA